MKSITNSSQFVVGFTSAILLIAGSALVLQAFKWFRNNHGSYIEFLTTPMFSFVDLFSWTAILLLTAVVAVSVKSIPR